MPYRDCLFLNQALNADLVVRGKNVNLFAGLSV
jgi:hypothetical protein